MDEKTIDEKAAYLVRLFGKTWMQNKLSISATTLRNRLDNNPGWNDEESTMINNLYHAPVKSVGRS